MSEGADVSLLEDEARQTTEDGWLKSCMIYNIVICLYLLGYGVWMGDIHSRPQENKKMWITLHRRHFIGVCVFVCLFVCLCKALNFKHTRTHVHQ